MSETSHNNLHISFEDIASIVEDRFRVLLF